MFNWWDMGEMDGFMGTELDYNEIECPFCNHRGNFIKEHHSEMKNPNRIKKLNFDTLKCNNCTGYILVFWSAGYKLHKFIMIPYSLKPNRYPVYLTEQVGRYWLQAKKNLIDENWEASAMLARTTIQIALREKNAEGINLKQEIENLSIKGILPKIIADWAQNLRELGNDITHPVPNQSATDPEDAKDIVYFLDLLLEYLFYLPKKINDYRERHD